ncbi:MAG: hypothetical protein ABI330_19310 [Caldimonas sp.]
MAKRHKAGAIEAEQGRDGEPKLLDQKTVRAIDTANAVIATFAPR